MVFILILIGPGSAFAPLWPAPSVPVEQGRFRVLPSLGGAVGTAPMYGSVRGVVGRDQGQPRANGATWAAAGVLLGVASARIAPVVMKAKTMKKKKKTKKSSRATDMVGVAVPTEAPWTMSEELVSACE